MNYTVGIFFVAKINELISKNKQRFQIKYSILRLFPKK